MPFAAGILLGLASYASRKIVGAGPALAPGERAKRQRMSQLGRRIGPMGLIGPIGSMLGRSEDASAADALTFRSYRSCKSHPCAALQYSSLCDLAPLLGNYSPITPGVAGRAMWPTLA